MSTDPAIVGAAPGFPSTGGGGANAAEKPAAGGESPSVVSTRTVEIAVAVLLLGFSGLMMFDNWRTGIGWAPDGPRPGYFPFYLSVIVACASLYWLADVTMKRRRGVPSKSFANREQLGRVLKVFVPTALFCAATQFLGIYVASFLLIAGFMRWIGHFAWWKCLVTSVVFSVAMFVVFDMAFDVIMPKGPIEALLGR